VLRMLLMSSRKLPSFIWLSLNRKTVGWPALPACKHTCTHTPCVVSLRHKGQCEAATWLSA
jgi:hypothetical protein